MRYLNVLREAVDLAADQSTLMGVLPEIQDCVDADEEGAAELMAHALLRETTLPLIAPTLIVERDDLESKGAKNRSADGTGVVVESFDVVPVGAIAPSGASKTFPNGKLCNLDWPVTTLRMKGKEHVEIPDPVYANVHYLMGEYGITARYNELKRRHEVEIPNVGYNEDNKRSRSRGKVLDLVTLNGLRMPDSRVDEAIEQLADMNSYHPVRDWIDSAKWDGVSRLADLACSLTVEERYEQHRNRILRRWLLSAVAAVYRHSREIITKFEGCLVLQGQQEAGKTMWYASLAPQATKAVKTSFKLVPSNKDHIFTLAAHWIVELGELDSTFSASEMGSLKAFMSDTMDCQRRAYGHEDSELTRQTVMGASVNKPDYLIDDTGNRRWWTIPVLSVNFNHGIDMQQLWAEVKELFMAGEQWWLSKEEMDGLRAVNREFGAIIPVKELITATFDFEPLRRQGELYVVGGEDNRPRVRLTATEIVRFVGLRADDRKTIGEAGRALRDLAGEPSSSSGQMVWRLVPREDSIHYGALKAVAERQNAYTKRRAA